MTKDILENFEDYWVFFNKRHQSFIGFAERLHRISNDGKGQFISWAQLYEQYGRGYSRIRDFRRGFLKHLLNVHAVYQDAKIEEEKNDSGQSKGLRLYHSRAPVLKKNFVILKPRKND